MIVFDMDDTLAFPTADMQENWYDFPENFSHMVKVSSNSDVYTLMTLAQEKQGGIVIATAIPSHLPERKKIEIYARKKAWIKKNFPGISIRRFDTYLTNDGTVDKTPSLAKEDILIDNSAENCRIAKEKGYKAIMVKDGKIVG